ncbi:hypothetical protein QFZ55_003634 [Streptomyces luteogriseus]|uniref:hypothetical protein n=1 Tax=Streptomyces luteogriseus TaxID=68233 RepID=UPI00277EF882|nr:hypothetical protein [Streptomyces luteogriseus]MDQ0714182.1 hypothetical protein [Streptomyces luteogriseus]
MGDHFQTIVDLDANGADAEPLARRVVEWLVAEGVVLAERTDCVLSLPMGHPPGPRWGRAVGEAAVDDEPWDGLAVHAGRTVFHGWPGGLEAAVCPRCSATTRLVDDGWAMIDEAWAPFVDAIGTWSATGVAQVRCPACARIVPLRDWAWNDDYFAFAHLGFEFWNWPELTPEFRGRVAELLDGHRTAYLRGKI